MLKVDFMALTAEADFESLAEDLRTRGFAIRPRLIPSSLCRTIREEMLRRETEFAPAGIGRAEIRQVMSEIRSDRTDWWDEATATPAQKEILAFLEDLRDALNRKLFLGLHDLEGHSAIYPPGAFYRTHLDRFRSDSRRTVSVVLFFNPDWKEEEGGLLRMETPEGEVRVLPEDGTMVMFLSDEIPHEVLETRRKRLSFAGWFRR